MLKYAQALLCIAEMFLVEFNFDEAITHFHEVMELNIEDPEVISRALLGLTRVYHGLKDDENYMKYSKLYIESLRA
jgi:hypothetical protein